MRVEKLKFKNINVNTKGMNSTYSTKFKKILLKKTLENISVSQEKFVKIQEVERVKVARQIQPSIPNLKRLQHHDSGHRRLITHSVPTIVYYSEQLAICYGNNCSYENYLTQLSNKQKTVGNVTIVCIDYSTAYTIFLYVY